MVQVQTEALGSKEEITLQVVSLRKEFSVPSGIEVAVDGIDFTVGEGEFITVVGPSGCGKTTTLRCVAGLETPTSGEIQINNEDVSDIPPNRRDMAMMFQDIALYPHMTIKDNIAYPLKVRNVPKAERYDEAEEAANLMQIGDLLDKYPAEVSGGQQQRAALARTIVQDPKVFLMDEPLSDLDAKLKVNMRKEVQRIHRRVQTPTIYVTHDQEEAMTMSDKVLVMNDGGIEQVGPPSEVYNRPVNMFVASFIGNPSINFLEGNVLNVSDSVAEIAIEGHTYDIAVDQSIHEYEGQKVVVGVRPEDVTLGVAEEGLSVDVLLTERIGDRILATLEGMGQELRAFVDATKNLEEGSKVTFSFAQDRVHLFDRESSDKIAQGPKLTEQK